MGEEYPTHTKTDPNQLGLFQSTKEQIMSKQTYTISDNDLSELRRRNEERSRAAAAALGCKYLIHPSNRVRRQPQQSLLRPPELTLL